MSDKSLGIVGGGISGLSAAYMAVKNGQEPKDIVVYESSNRLGGQIGTANVGGVPVNIAAEFIDKEHKQLIEMARDLGVPLVKATDQDKLSFQGKNGSKITDAEFFTKYAPIAKRIKTDKAEVAANLKGELAKRLNNLSAEEYLKELGDITENVANLTTWQKFKNLITLSPNKVDPEVIATIAGAFASEVGQPANKATALQFVHEASDKDGVVFESNCDFRVEGGTEQIIKALHEKLEQQGVKFTTNAEVSSIEKDDDGNLNLKLKSGENIRHGKAIMALPAYELAKIDGLESLGFAPDDRKFLSELQYTKNMKVTIKVAPGMEDKVANENMYFDNGAQSWVSSPSIVTFLISDNGKGSKARLEEVLGDYAKANGLTTKEMFGADYMREGNISINKPTKRACYVTPAKGQALRLENMDISMARLAANNIGIAGTFLPSSTQGAGVSLGFMNNGVESAASAVQGVMAEREESMQNLLAKQKQSDQQAGKSLS